MIADILNELGVLGREHLMELNMVYPEFQLPFLVRVGLSMSLFHFHGE